ncbi:hypothetical protein GRAN_2378 [Granulicella sibirica]|uniref:Uncharacterized protein n=1 Tax=Granulicella sibirica TaxID=2479048 RepID=A0A4Q0T1U5_9BACT|nr:hypothetical protein GRAN_2378 [Granulicella sibirica]
MCPHRRREQSRGRFHLVITRNEVLYPVMPTQIRIRSSHQHSIGTQDLHQSTHLSHTLRIPHHARNGSIWSRSPTCGCHSEHERRNNEFYPESIHSRKVVPSGRRPSPEALSATASGCSMETVSYTAGAQSHLPSTRASRILVILPTNTNPQ